MHNVEHTKTEIYRIVHELKKEEEEEKKKKTGAGYYIQAVTFSIKLTH